jgi:23S rRNA (guanosine2251-2'-O)-methyltransferase
MDREIILIAHNVRSCHNVGSLLRTAEGLGVAKVWLTGYTPYPMIEGDDRLPHLAQKIHKQIQKTALGAEISQAWEQSSDIEEVINDLSGRGFMIAALEQTPGSVSLPKIRPPEKIAILLGQEVEGLSPQLLALAHTHLEIPMFGKKESFNVVQAAAMALYHCRFS